MRMVADIKQTVKDFKKMECLEYSVNEKLVFNIMKAFVMYRPDIGYIGVKNAFFYF
jgi:hypothetical protein